MKQSTWFLFAAALVALLYWFRKTLIETTKTIIGDVTSNTEIVAPEDPVPPDPKVVSVFYGNDGQQVLVLDDGRTIYRTAGTGTFTTQGTVVSPPIFGFESKP